MYITHKMLATIQTGNAITIATTRTRVVGSFKQWAQGSDFPRATSLRILGFAVAQETPGSEIHV